MGGAFSRNHPSEKRLQAMWKVSPISQHDLIDLKRLLFRVQAKDGGITLAKWQESMKKVGIDNATFVREFYGLFDDRKRNWVDYQSFAVYSALVGRPRRASKIRYLFQAFDRSGTHWLTRGDLMMLLCVCLKTFKRVKFLMPGKTMNTPTIEYPSFDLSEEERDACDQLSLDIFAEVRVVKKKICFHEMIESGDRISAVKEFLDLFESLSRALPRTIRGHGLSDEDFGDDWTEEIEEQHGLLTEDELKAARQCPIHPDYRGYNEDTGSDGDERDEYYDDSKNEASNKRGGLSKKGKKKKNLRASWSRDPPSFYAPKKLSKKGSKKRRQARTTETKYGSAGRRRSASSMSRSRSMSRSGRSETSASTSRHSRGRGGRLRHSSRSRSSFSQSGSRSEGRARRSNPNYGVTEEVDETAVRRTTPNAVGSGGRLRRHSKNVGEDSGWGSGSRNTTPRSVGSAGRLRRHSPGSKRTYAARALDIDTGTIYGPIPQSAKAPQPAKKPNPYARLVDTDPGIVGMQGPMSYMSPSQQYVEQPGSVVYRSARRRPSRSWSRASFSRGSRRASPEDAFFTLNRSSRSGRSSASRSAFQVRRPSTGRYRSRSVRRGSRSGGSGWNPFEADTTGAAVRHQRRLRGYRPARRTSIGRRSGSGWNPFEANTSEDVRVVRTSSRPRRVVRRGSVSRRSSVCSRSGSSWNPFEANTDQSASYVRRSSRGGRRRSVSRGSFRGSRSGSSWNPFEAMTGSRREYSRSRSRGSVRSIRSSSRRSGGGSSWNPFEANRSNVSGSRRSSVGRRPRRYTRRIVDPQQQMLMQAPQQTMQMVPTTAPDGSQVMVPADSFGAQPVIGTPQQAYTQPSFQSVQSMQSMQEPQQYEMSQRMSSARSRRSRRQRDDTDDSDDSKNELPSGPLDVFFPFTSQARAEKARAAAKDGLEREPSNGASRRRSRRSKRSKKDKKKKKKDKRSRKDESGNESRRSSKGKKSKKGDKSKKGSTAKDGKTKKGKETPSKSKGKDKPRDSKRGSSKGKKDSTRKDSTKKDKTKKDKTKKDATNKGRSSKDKTSKSKTNKDKSKKGGSKKDKTKKNDTKKKSSSKKDKTKKDKSKAGSRPAPALPNGA